MDATVPALPPPLGIQSNFQSRESQSYVTVIPCAVIVGIMIILVFIRMYTKVYILKSVGWDDYTCIFAALSSLAFLGFLMALYQLGFGVHQWDITYVRLSGLLSKEGRCLSALWGPTMFFTKLSLLLLYYRLFAPDRMTKYLVFFGIFYCFILYTSYLLLTFLLCQSQIVSTCKHQWNLFLLITSGLNVLGDFYLLFVPLVAVAKLRIPFRQKLGVSAVFFTGLLACSSGILALYYRIQLLNTQDSTWHFTPVFISTVMEINTGIIVSCMPTVPALVQDIRSQVTKARKASPKFAITTGHTSKNTSRSKSNHPSKNNSRSKSHQKNSSDQRSQGQPMAELPNRRTPVELDGTPIQMEEARTYPRSYFSDDSSDYDDRGYGGYWWLS
ncbi:MAG: hypothetical protein L6R38_002396 [Xanthoria sp. 2 TBL-2021]|nr:MAG: hypothetical protein L6R38_002396 [Xanthoria sp. 2 TBL-2021]